MGFSHLSESIKETNDKISGFITGRLIVALDKKSIELEQLKSGKTIYVPLSEQSHIEVRNGSEYQRVSFNEILDTQDHLMGCSLYAGMYARVKTLDREKNFKLPDLDKMSDIEAKRWYTGEVASLGKDHNYDKEYVKELTKWKKQMNNRLKKNKDKGLER